MCTAAKLVLQHVHCSQVSAAICALQPSQCCYMCTPAKSVLQPVHCSQVSAATRILQPSQCGYKYTAAKPVQLYCSRASAAILQPSQYSYTAAKPVQLYCSQASAVHNVYMLGIECSYRHRSAATHCACIATGQLLRTVPVSPQFSCYALCLYRHRSAATHCACIATGQLLRTVLVSPQVSCYALCLHRHSSAATHCACIATGQLLRTVLASPQVSWYALNRPALNALINYRGQTVADCATGGSGGRRVHRRVGGQQHILPIGNHRKL